jgi:GNAT superfamily N-acetyltransferase
MPVCTFEKAEIDDFDAVMLLLRQLWPGTRLNREKIRAAYVESLGNTNYGYFIAKAGGKPVGLVSYMYVRSLWQPRLLCQINELVVDSEMRGLGIGTILLNKVVSMARRHRCARVELDSGFFRKSAHKFYVDKGFEKRAFLFSKKLK